MRLAAAPSGRPYGLRSAYGANDRDVGGGTIEHRGQEAAVSKRMATGISCEATRRTSTDRAIALFRGKSMPAASASTPLSTPLTPCDRGFLPLRQPRVHGSVRPQVDRHLARLRPRCRTIQGSRWSQVALSIKDGGASTSPASSVEDW
jgi:hypothetical protein